MVVAGELVVASCDPAPVLEPAEHSLDEVALDVGCRIEGERLSSVATIRDDGRDVPPSECASKALGIIIGVGQKRAGRAHNSFEQCQRDWKVVGLSARDDEGARSALLIGESVDLGCAATPRTADRLRQLPPFPPAAERCAFTRELSAMRACGLSTAASASSNCAQRPRPLQRLKRLYTVVGGPYSAGQSRHRQPERSTWMIPLKTRRSSTRSGPVCFIGRCGRIAAHSASLSQNRFAMIQSLPRHLNPQTSIEFRP